MSTKNPNQVSKREIIEQLSEHLGKSMYEVNEILEAFTSYIYDQLNQGKVVNLTGFGKFSVRYRAPRRGVNPRTKEEMLLPAYNTPKFEAGSVFKKAIKLLDNEES